jgi:FAD synthetase
MGENKVDKSKSGARQVRIMVFGTFDILHPGHLHFFKQARALAKNPYLIVSIARDINVKRIKGKLPLHNERQRAALVRYSGLADKVVFGDREGYIRHIIKHEPAIILLGYDQRAYTENLKGLLPSNIFIKRARPYRPDLHKTSIIKKFYDYTA